MSRPAFKPSHNRTTECPTCGEPRLHPCHRIVNTDADMRAGLDHGWTVSPHAARLRAEAALREQQRADR